jgi:hypothetical protein
MLAEERSDDSNRVEGTSRGAGNMLAEERSDDSNRVEGTSRGAGNMLAERLARDSNNIEFACKRHIKTIDNTQGKAIKNVIANIPYNDLRIT